jgi:hypothetical protein
MTTMTVPDIPLDATAPAQRLRRMAAAVRVHFTWWGVHKTLSPRQKEEVGQAYSADAKFLTAGKKLVDTRHEAFRKLTSIRTRVTDYWRERTLPYVEAGVRLIGQADVESFVHTLEGFRDELTQGEFDLAVVFDQLKADARQRLGRLYEASDYPSEVRGLFGLTWDFPSVEPPSYLLRIAPEVYHEEQQRVVQRFEEAVKLAEQAFAAELSDLVAHLTERLSGSEDGKPRIFRDSVVNNLREFFQRFARLNVRSNPDLDALVEQAQQLVRGVTPQGLREDADLRQQVATQMAKVRQQVEGLLVERPRRRLVRPAPERNGVRHAAHD